VRTAAQFRHLPPRGSLQCNETRRSLRGATLAPERRANMELAAFALMGSLTLMVLEIVDERRRDKLPR